MLHYHKNTDMQPKLVEARAVGGTMHRQLAAVVIEELF